MQVDEVQDLNPLQWAILDTLSDETTHVFAVGDELQSIYAFLGADVAHLQARTKTFTTHRLVNNYRAQPPLVDILNAYREQHWQLPAIQAQQPTTDPASTLLIGAANWRMRWIWPCAGSLRFWLIRRATLVCCCLPTS